MNSITLIKMLMILSMSIILASATNTSFKLWKEQFGVEYSSLAEHFKRQSIFEKNLQIILSHNQNPENTYTMGVNKFTAYETNEVIALFTGYKPKQRNDSIQMYVDETEDAKILASAGSLPAEFGKELYKPFSK